MRAAVCFACLFLSLLGPQAFVGAAPPTASDRSPAAGLKSMIARPGFEVELVAAEPLVMDPVAFAWGPDAKLWVVEMADYPLGIDGRGKFGGRVRYLEDTDGDGKYDRSTLFLDGLGYPNGVLPWHKGVLITCAPEILYAEDTDGDGKADLRKILYVGFKEGNQQHRVNGLRWGLDNWVHCANGDSGGKIESKLTGEKIDIGGRDFRIRPDQGFLDPQTGVSQFTRISDQWGNWFGTNNSRPLMHYVLADEYLRRNPHLSPPQSVVDVSVVPGAAPIYPLSPPVARFNDLNKVNRFTSACGAALYDDELFGAEYVGNSFVCEPVHNLVHREVVSRSGLTFTSRRADDEKKSEFLASTDTWSRPVMARTGPDGALWVADMVRETIEHPEWIPKDWQQRLDLRAGHDQGRIYRIYPIGKRPRPIARLDQLDTAGLVASLDGPSGYQRDMARMLLVHRQDKSAIEPLKLLCRSAQRPQGKVQALCALDGLDAIDTPTCVAAMSDEHPAVRRHAIRVGERLLNDAPVIGVALTGLIADPAPQVRLQVAYSLGAWRDPRAGVALGKLAVASSDEPYLIAAIMSSLTSANLPAVVMEAVKPDGHRTPSGHVLEPLTTMVIAVDDPAAVGPLVRAIATPKDGQYQAWQLAALRTLLDALDRRKLTLAAYREKASEELRSELARLPDLFTFARRITTQQTTAQQTTPESDRILALGLLGRGPDQRDRDLTILGELLVPQTPTRLQTAAVAALAQLNDPRVPELLLADWKSFGPQLRSQVLDVLMSRSNWLSVLLESIEKGDVLPTEIDASHAQRLTEHKDEKIRTRAIKLLAGSRNSDRQKVVEEYQDAITLTGDSSRGIEVFKKRCVSCHKLGDVGNAVGPDLTALTDKSPRSMLAAVLDPNRAVEAKYINYTAVTSAGLTYTGMLASESGNSIILLAAEGKQVPLLRSDLEVLSSSSKSLMPEGLEKDLSRQDLADLFALLGQTPAARKTFAGNRPELVRPEGLRGEFYLLAEQAEIYGPTLVWESRYNNLGFWRSEGDHAVWSIELSKPAKYEFFLEYACAGDAAGNDWILSVDDQRLIGKVTSTRSWDDYRSMAVGRIALESGVRRIDLRADGKIQGALMDLKSIRIRPVP
jgi:putative membrane-bound dehydrogenase-like protein